MSTNSTTLDIPLTTPEELLEDLDLVQYLPPRIKHYVFYECLYPVSAKAILDVWNQATHFFMSRQEKDEIEIEILESIKEVSHGAFLKETTYIEGMYT